MFRSVLFLIAFAFLLTGFAFNSSGLKEDIRTSAKSTAIAADLKAGDKTGRLAGSVTGKVIFQGEAPPRLKQMIVKDTDVCSRGDQYDEGLLVSQNNGIQNAVVYITGVSNGKPLSSLGSKFVLDQQGCRYLPHVLLVPVNSPMEIINDDGILHNFHTFCRKNRPINIAQPESRKKMEISFKRPEFIQVRCDIHGWMNCWMF